MTKESIVVPTGLELDRNSSVPLHVQLRDILRQMIVSGDYEVGQTFLPEHVIESRFHISRTTVREAVADLVSSGYLTRQRGKGTFITRNSEAFEASRLTSFSEDMAQRGHDAGSEVLTLRRVPTPISLAKQFPNHADLWEIFRLRFADAEPIALQRSFVPANDYIFGRSDLERGSLYQLIGQHYGLQATSADEIITAAVATPEQAGLLSIDRGAPLLHVERTTFAQQGQIIEYVQIDYRADRYSFHVHRSKGG
ncbi:MAG: GntR family transcriptional regulator [Trueperaceae bacterium]|nr:GntR family transcriptional regulator [Trueperaceae bacterium]